MNSKSWSERVSKDPKETYTRGEVKQLLDTILPEYHFFSVDKIRAGDVFYYRVVGGKSRPWVCLWVKKGLVGCATITHSEKLPMSHKAQCRFFKDSYIGPTLTVVEEIRVLDSVMGSYTNKKHLREVRQKVKETWGA